MVKGDHTFDCRDGTVVLRAGGAVSGMGHGGDISDYAALRIPGILYGWGIAVFCYAILYQFWKVCVQIGRDNSFSGENARSFVVISRLAFVLAVVWFAGILFLVAKRALGPAFLIFMILLIFINVVIAVLAAALSHLIYKSYEMKQDAELTI